MGDNRGVLHGDAWKASAVEGLKWLGDWPTQVWTGVAARILGPRASGRVLLDKTMQAGFVMLAYMEHEIFRHLDQYPWLLFQGDDLARKLEELKHGPDVTEYTTWKIQKLLRQGSISKPELLAGLRLLQEAPWTTTCT